MPEQSGHTEAGPTTILTSFTRRNSRNGAIEQIRVTTNTFKGKHYLHARVWTNRTAGQPDDKWEASFEGVAFPENRLDELLEAVQHVRQLVHDEHRSTCVPPPGQPKNPRVQTAASKRRDAAGLPPLGRSAFDKARAHRAELDKGGNAPILPSGGNGKPSLLDDLAEYR